MADGATDPGSRKVKANKGTLDNGERYVIYRFALYARGLLRQPKSINDFHSVDGCYLLPLGIPAHLCISIAAARAIKLTPHEQKLNNALNLVLDDIFTGAVHHTLGMAPGRRPIGIFLDLVCLFGDYPAISEVNDAIGQYADPLCTNSGFKKRKRSNYPQIINSTRTHSRILGFMRFDE